MFPPSTDPGGRRDLAGTLALAATVPLVLAAASHPPVVAAGAAGLLTRFAWASPATAPRFAVGRRAELAATTADRRV